MVSRISLHLYIPLDYINPIQFIRAQKNVVSARRNFYSAQKSWTAHARLKNARKVGFAQEPPIYLCYQRARKVGQITCSLSFKFHFPSRLYLFSLYLFWFSHCLCPSHSPNTTYAHLLHFILTKRTEVFFKIYIC
jgi:hypothetical protein